MKKKYLKAFGALATLGVAAVALTSCGDVEHTVKFMNGTTEVTSQTVKDGYNATVPAAPTGATGATFNGWYADSALTKPFNFGSVITEDTTVYANWYVASNVTVTFNTNGGSSVAAATVVSGKNVAVPTAPTKTGYTFNGWYADSALTKAFDFGSIVSANTTVYARWEAVPVTPVTPEDPTPEDPVQTKFTVTYNLGGHGDAINALTEVDELPEELPAPTAEGYIFRGWYYDADFEEEAYAEDPIDANTTLYAKWDVNAVEDIIVDKTNVITEYVVGETFTTKNLVVKASYVDASEKTLSASDYTVKVVATDDVNAAAVTELAVTGDSHKTTYYVYVILNTDNTIRSKYSITVEDKYAIYNTFADADKLDINSAIKQDIPWVTSSTGTSIVIKGSTTGSGNNNDQWAQVDANSKKRLGEGRDGSDNYYSKRYRIGNSVIKGADQATTSPATLETQVIVVTAANPGTLTIEAISGSSSENRHLRVADAEPENATVCENLEFEGGSEILAKHIQSVDIPAAGTYYIYGLDKDVYIYGIRFAEKKYLESSVTTTAIEVTTEPTKLQYNLGDSLDVTGIGVSAVLSNGDKSSIDLKKLEFVDSEGNAITTLDTAAPNYTVTVKYETFTASFEVQVLDPNAVLDSFEFTTEPTKLQYNLGDSLDVSDFVAIAKTKSGENEYIYNDELNSESEGVTVKLFNGETEITNTTKLASGVYTLKISFTLGEVTKTIEKTIKVFGITAITDSTGGKDKMTVNTSHNIDTVALKVTQEDGVEEDKKTDVAWTKDIVITYYSDSACTQVVEDITKAAVGNYFYKLSYGTLVAATVYTLAVNEPTTQGSVTLDFSKVSKSDKGTDLTANFLTAETLTIKDSNGADVTFSIGASSTNMKVEANGLKFQKADTSLTFDTSAETTIKVRVNIGGGSADSPRTIVIKLGSTVIAKITRNGGTDGTSGTVDASTEAGKEFEVGQKAFELTISNAGAGAWSIAGSGTYTVNIASVKIEA